MIGFGPPCRVANFCARGWAVRIYASQATHIVLDVTGLTVGTLSDTGEEEIARKSARLTRRQARQAKLRTRLAKSVGQRAAR